jgi:hypothetical protein
LIWFLGIADEYKLDFHSNGTISYSGGSMADESFQYPKTTIFGEDHHYAKIKLTDLILIQEEKMCFSQTLPLRVTIVAGKFSYNDLNIFTCSEVANENSADPKRFLLLLRFLSRGCVLDQRPK